MRTSLSLLLVFITSLLFAQETTIDSTENDDNILKTFISKLADESIATDVILSQYVTIEAPSDDMYDYLEVSLDEIRINLMSKNIEEINYIPYNKMPKKEIKDIDLENLNPNDVYFLHYKNRQMLAIYLENGKIGSFTLVANGNGKAHFVLYKKTAESLH